MSKQYVFSQSEAAKVSKYGIDLDIYGNNSGVVRVKVQVGHLQEFKHTKSTFTYYIIKGEGTFYLDGQPNPAKTGDLVVIPPNTKIYYFGTMEMVLITSPAWTEEDEIHIRYIDKNESPYVAS